VKFFFFNAYFEYAGKMTFLCNNFVATDTGHWAYIRCWPVNYHLMTIVISVTTKSDQRKIYNTTVFSNEVKDLLQKNISFGPSKRINIQQTIQHPWIKDSSSIKRQPTQASIMREEGKDRVAAK
jgi:serine/threonine protein kinase